MKTSIVASYIYLVTSSLLYGLLVFGGKMMSLSGFSLVEVLIMPNLIILLLLAITIKPELKKFFSVSWWVSLLYLITVIFGQIGQFAPLFMGLSVSLTVFILYTQPLWTSLISTIFLKTKFTKKDAVLIFMMLLGLLFLLSPWQEFKFSIWGFLTALMGGIAMSGWIIINGSFYAKKNLKPISITFFTNAYQSIPFLLILPLFMKIIPDSSVSGFSFDKDLNVILLVFLYSVSVFIAAPCLFYTAAKKINNIHLGLVLLLEPVVATILDSLFLHTPITWNILLGGLLILGANAYLVIKSSKKEIIE